MGVKIIKLEGKFEGWHVELKDSVSARILIELDSGSADRALVAFSKMVLAHNFKDIDGNPAIDILDAPIDALSAVMRKWSESNALDPQ